MTDDELVDRMAEAIGDAAVEFCGGDPARHTLPVLPSQRAYARAALAVARPAIRDEALGEVERGVEEILDRMAEQGDRVAVFGAMQARNFARSLRLDSKGE